LAHCDSVDAEAAQQTTPAPDKLAGYLDRPSSMAARTALSSYRAPAWRRGEPQAWSWRWQLSRTSAGPIWNATAQRPTTALPKSGFLVCLKSNGVAVLNADDAVSQSILSKQNHPVLTFGLHNQADVTASVLERSQGSRPSISRLQ